MTKIDSKFNATGFEDFRRLASDTSLSPHEKIGFPDSYREGKGLAILDDIWRKIPALFRTGAVILDIGCGCGELAELLVERCRREKHRAVLVDSPEMLSHLKPENHLEMVAGRFPDMPEFLEKNRNRFDAIVVYSVMHYVFAEGSWFHFVDQAVSLLRPGGALLLGDIPNVSKRRRFFSSETGIRFHQEFMKTTERPVVDPYQLEPGSIDDGVIMSTMIRYRGFGFETYVLPQAADLPMANRREDLLIVRN